MCQSDGAADATEEKPDSKESAVDFYHKALDDLVNVNSTFTMAVFISMSFQNSTPVSLLKGGENSHCFTNPKQEAKHLFVNEVISFSCFILSSLVAKALKMQLSTYLLEGESILPFMGHRAIRASMLLISTLASILGCLYLTQSMVNLIRILLGRILCGCSDTLHAVGPLIAVNSLALLIYVPFMICAVKVAAMRLDDAGGK